MTAELTFALQDSFGSPGPTRLAVNGADTLLDITEGRYHARQPPQLATVEYASPPGSRADTLTAPAKVLDPELRALAEFAAPPGEFLELIEGESVMRALARL